MTYETAKKLKDAGFPQDVWDFTLSNYAYNESEELHLLHYDNDTGWLIGNDYQSCKSDGIDWTKEPTLSELIEACGEGFYDLQQKPKKEGWEATAFLSLATHAEGKGDTPEEAVANLWLALNDKKE